MMHFPIASPNRTRGSCGQVALWAACILALAAVNASAQQGGCQGGGGGRAGGTATGGGTGTGTTTSTASLTAALNMASLRGGLATTGTNPTASALQSMQAHSNQFRQAQLNALAANAQLRADTQAMWAAARERKQQALALRERTVASRTK